MNAEWALTEPEAQALLDRGEWFAAGFLAGAGVPVVVRHARGIAAFLSHAPLPEYDGGLLYPCGRSLWAPAPDAEPTALPLGSYYVALDVQMDAAAAARKRETARSDAEREALAKLQRFCETYPRGGGWTHSILNYGRALAEGLDAYGDRIRRRSEGARPEVRELYDALLLALSAIDACRQRVADYLAALQFDDGAAERNRLRLATAYASRLPMRPAAGFREAMVATTFLYALDGCDNLGRFDQFMSPYYAADIASGRVEREETVELVRALWRYVDDCGGWNVALGGTTPDGREASTDLTLVCLEAGRNQRRPNLALRLREDTPEAVWDAAIDTIGTGAGLPALYGEESYRRAIEAARLNLPITDARQFAFGGCTELMVHGCSNVGSLDADISVIKVLEESLHRSLGACDTFERFYEAYAADLRAEVAATAERVCRNQEARARYHPQLVRTLLIDDCVDAGREYYDGGARYNWSVVNIVGLSNAIDSLSAVRHAVFDERRATADELLCALRANFEGCDELHGYLSRCPRFGNDEPEVNALAEGLSGLVYREFKRYAPWRGGRFLCGTLMFVTYGWFGQPVGATPDGRLASTPVGDSAGPVQGRDRRGPTAMLRATASLAQVHAPGTLVVNLRVSREHVATPDGRARLKALIRTYFALGGLQLQVNVVDQAVLRDAIDHPERHGDLVVRVGGYSEYFNRLDDDLKRSILERTEHR